MYGKLYSVLATFGFGIATLLLMLGQVIDARIFTDFGIAGKFLIGLFYLISFWEATFIKTTLLKGYGYALPILHFVCVFSQYTAFPLPFILVYIFGIGILLNLILAALIDKNKNWFHFLLMGFLLQSLLLMHLPAVPWMVWVVLTYCIGITGAAILNSRQIETAEKG